VPDRRLPPLRHRWACAPPSPSTCSLACSADAGVTWRTIYNEPTCYWKSATNIIWIITWWEPKSLHDWCSTNKQKKVAVLQKAYNWIYLNIFQDAAVTLHMRFYSRLMLCCHCVQCVIVASCLCLQNAGIIIRLRRWHWRACTSSVILNTQDPAIVRSFCACFTYANSSFFF
jgi:hypothetical protein